MHDARFVWLGLSPRKFRQRAARRARRPAFGAASRAGLADGAGALVAEMARVLRPGGHALLMVGDGVLAGRAEHAPDGIAAAGAPVGLEPVARASQVAAPARPAPGAIFAAAPAASTCCCSVV